MEDARAEASRQGTRLAVRLGGPTDNPCVAAYDRLQVEYRQLVAEVMDGGLGAKLNTRKVEQRLDALGTDQTYHDEASTLLTPITTRAKMSNPRRLRGPSVNAGQ
jgi:hypothetical protein